MKFSFMGTQEEWLDTLYQKAYMKREILIHFPTDNTVQIGFQRQGHTSGRFFIAEIIEVDGRTVFIGETANLSDDVKQNCRKPSLRQVIIGMLNSVSHSKIRINEKTIEERKADDDFFRFLSTFMQPDFWWAVSHLLDAKNGKMEMCCDDCEDMVLITYDDGMQIDVGYIEAEKTYYITVTASDTLEAWNHPLQNISVTDKFALFDELQNCIHTWRGESKAE